jgi:hypothetical protein
MCALLCYRSLLPATKVSLNPTHLCEADFNFFRSCNFPSIEEFFLLITQTRQKLIHHAFMPLESVLKVGYVIYSALLG